MNLEINKSVGTIIAPEDQFMKEFKELNWNRSVGRPEIRNRPLMITEQPNNKNFILFLLLLILLCLIYLYIRMHF